MKLKNEFIFQEWGNDSLLIPTGAANFSGVMRGNKTLGIILGLLTKETTKESIVTAMCDQFEASEAVIARDVEKALEELRKIDALEE